MVTQHYCYNHKEKDTTISNAYLAQKPLLQMCDGFLDKDDDIPTTLSQLSHYSRTELITQPIDHNFARLLSERSKNGWIQTSWHTIWCYPFLLVCTKQFSNLNPLMIQMSDAQQLEHCTMHVVIKMSTWCWHQTVKRFSISPPPLPISF